jgi:hypothetical protein
MLFEENSEIVKNFFIKQSQLSNQNNLINICNSNSQNSSLPESRNLGINDYKIIKIDKSKIQEYNKKNSKISMIKQNILDKETERQFDNNKKQNNSNKNIINVYKKNIVFWTHLQFKIIINIQIHQTVITIIIIKNIIIFLLIELLRIQIIYKVIEKEK